MDATQPVATKLPARHIARPGRIARRLTIGVLLGALAVVVGLAAFSQWYAGRILPGTVVGGVDVSGMTPGDARAALDAALGGLEDGQITVTSSRSATVIGFDEVGRFVDRDAMVGAALGHGRTGTRFEESIAGIRSLLAPVAMPIVIGYDEARLAARLVAFREEAKRPAVDAAVRIVKTGFVVRGAMDGVTVDTDRVANEIDRLLLDPTSPRTAELAAESIAIPPLTADADAARALAVGQRMAREITIVAGKREWTITAKRIRTWMSFGGTGASYGPVIDATTVPDVLKKPQEAVLTKPRDATFLRTRSGGVFGVAASSAGRALDVTKTVDSIVARLDGRATGRVKERPINATTMAVAPEISTSEATKKAPLVQRIGSWTTYYQVSARNGFAANITVPARRLDGVVVRPGQTFEFWGALGEVSFRTGYRLGAAIVGGRTVEGRALAGGICSVSTTLFNAAARGGLDIVTRSAHWYYIDRYPLGLDATVSDSQTMRFRNDTKHPVLIKSFASPGVVRFELWSVPNGRTVTWSKPRVANVVRGYDTVQYTSSLRRGERKRIEYPVDGRKVWVTRTVRDASGRTINRDTFVSNYHRMIGITLVGR